MSETRDEAELAARVEAATTVLRADVGTWDAELEVTPAPGMAPVRSKGVATTRLVGDRWLVVDIESDGGFAGHGVYGWDAALGEYVSIWVDSMQSSPARGRGRWDPATATMTYEVEAWNAGQVIRYREQTERVSDDTHVYRNLLPTPDGGEFEMIRTVYRRRT
ncbi:MAG TPA: DUF1579 family protein [Actinomycetes bacterium]|nr:DUF1579 family protein [Actinomycetes bacterium]